MAAATLTTDVAAAPEVASRRAGLPVHVAAFALLLLAVAAFGHLGASWTSDDGAYAVQVATVRASGEWAQPASAVDPDLTSFAYPNSTRSGDRGFVYVQHPAWVALLVATTTVAGHVVGLYVLNLLAAVAAAACAWVLAGRLDRRLAPAAFWLAALGPLLIHGPTIWAHATAAALGGVAALALLRLAGERPRVRDAVVLAAASGALVLIRSEGLLFAGAAVVGLTVAHLARHRLRRLGDLVVAAGPTAVVAVLAKGLEVVWVRRLVPGATLLSPLEAGTARGWLPGRVEGAVASFLEPGPPLLGLGVVLLLAAVVLVRRGESARPVPAALAVAGAVLVGVAAVTEPEVLVGGLFLAAPVAALGWIGWRPSRAGHGERLLAGVTVAFMALVALTQYPVGGGFEWGGRFLAVVLVPFTVIGVRGMADLLERMDPASLRSGAIRLMAVVTVVLAALGLWATTDARRAADARVRAIAATHPEVVVSLEPGLPRFAWRTVPATTWFQSDPSGAAALVARAHEGGAARIVVAGEGADRVRVPGLARRVVDDRLVAFAPP